MRYQSIPGVVFCMALCARAIAAEPFPFVIPWDDASPSFVNVSSLNDGDAGKNGFIVVKDGHFVESKTGQRLRFFAVNLAAGSAFPVHADAEKLAGRLAKYGVNLVRLHHMDNGWSQPVSLIDFSYKDRQHLNPEQLDRLDYLIYQLKMHGIYCNINLHVSRTFGEGDGFPASIAQVHFDFDKRIDYFDKKMIELQKDYAKNLLAHVNPYTHQPYTAEPAVLNVEFTNEDSLLGDPWSGLGHGLSDLPAPFSTELQDQWNDWLGKKYTSTDRIVKAWTAGIPPSGPEMLAPTPVPASWALEHQATTSASLSTGSQAITEGAELLNQTDDPASWALEQHDPDTTASMESLDGALKVAVTKVDGTDWHVQIHQAGIDLKEGKSYTFSFRAKADAARSLPTNAALDEDDWHHVGLGQQANLTTDWQTFRFPLTPENVVAGHTRVGFVLGGSTGVIWLSDVSLKEDMPAPVTAPAADALKILVDKVDDTAWHVQLHQVGMDFINGETYSLHFRARSDRRRTMNVYTGLDEADWHNIGLNAQAPLTAEWKTFDYLFTVHDPLPGHGRLTFGLGDQAGSVWLADVSLRKGLAEPPIKADQSLTSHSIPIPAQPFRQQASDWLAFLSDTERNYAVDMRKYMKDDLHLQSLMICSQVSYGGIGGVHREAPMDFIDNHAYWQHPSFPRRAWDSVDWNIGDTSMVSALGKNDTLSSLARERILGKPYTLSEYNHPAPNEYQAETVPLLASFAAFQDWDALYLFDYGSYGSQARNDRIDGFFGVGSNPAKWAFVPAAAMIFRSSEIGPAEKLKAIRLAGTPDLSKVATASALYGAAGIPLKDAFTERIGLAIDGVQVPVNAHKSEAATTVSINADVPENARFTADSPMAKVVVGFVGGQAITLPGVTLTFGDLPNRFAALTLTAMDQKSLSTSAKILLTAADRVENTGMQWTPDHKSIGNNWGTAPSVADGVPVNVRLSVEGPRKVSALDDTGKPVKTIPTTYKDGALEFNIGPEDTALWYAIEKP